MIRAPEVTTASTHDSQIDLSEEGEVVYRDRGYSGVQAEDFNATMQRGVRGYRSGSVTYSESLESPGSALRENVLTP